MTKKDYRLYFQIDQTTPLPNLLSILSSRVHNCCFELLPIILINVNWVLRLPLHHHLGALYTSPHQLHPLQQSLLHPARPNSYYRSIVPSRFSSHYISTRNFLRTELSCDTYSSVDNSGPSTTRSVTDLPPRVTRIISLSDKQTNK
jgi:hypothetical protein